MLREERFLVRWFRLAHFSSFLLSSAFFLAFRFYSRLLLLHSIEIYVTNNIRRMEKRVQSMQFKNLLFHSSAWIALHDELSPISRPPKTYHFSQIFQIKWRESERGFHMWYVCWMHCEPSENETEPANEMQCWPQRVVIGLVGVLECRSTRYVPSK